MGECEPRNFLQPCLLLLLRERSDHGYDLVNRLRVLHAVDGDAGAVYRALRGLEKQGMVRSSWQTSDAGPARRTYQVTQLGLATLDRQAYILEETHQTLHLFRERYRHLAGLAGSDGTRPVGANGGSGNGVGGVGLPGGTNGTNGVGGGGHSVTGNGGGGHAGIGNGGSGHADAVNGAIGNGGSGNGSRRDGNSGATAGGAYGDPGGRGVRPARLPGQRAGD